MISSEKSQKLPRLLVILLLSLLGLLILWRSFRNRTKNYSQPSQPTKGNPTTAKQLDGLVSFALPSWTAEQRRFVLAVAAHESGLFTSRVYKENNNAFGMKFPVKRLTTAKYEKNNYAYYDSVSESIIDFDLWLSFYKKKISDFANVGALVDFMGSKKYFEADLDAYKKAVTIHYGNILKE